ncbi:nitrous oxide reductase accessory protein NosL [Bowmanella yangjiangensis]|uniref:Nitrous oxide reductase accessory protein NosL n=1 Tax=Bowmanella yangjiangensis TaxID=2811230 RepID=A0ABS3D0G1_9ALTE|nr:nitrous oxide reductase accessory protein NosL [Bowmanella yangjiangensis]
MRLANLVWLVPAVSLLLGGCGDKVAQNEMIQPTAFHSDDECHVCGMVITRFPGPKGQALDAAAQQVRKFCSASEMLSWWMQPENRQANLTLYVHDMGKSQWDKPDDAHLIPAAQAFYVPAPDLPGAMGLSLGSFSDKQAAQQFADAQHSEVLSLDEVVARLSAAPVAAHHGHH